LSGEFSKQELKKLVKGGFQVFEGFLELVENGSGAIVDHGGVVSKAAGQLRYRLLLARGCQRHLGLQFSTVPFSFVVHALPLSKGTTAKGPGSLTENI
jgi:hypothetical protein